ncbi:MAG: hypothetical protein RJA36_2619 [Pseudomonadota bacterium]
MPLQSSPPLPARRMLLLGLLALGSSSFAMAAPAALPALQVWKDPDCGCCKDWIAQLERNGFAVSVIEQGNSAARARLGMPQQYGSCHTALVQGYVIEGHVPAADIRRLLRDRPQALGLAVPGMPVGAPGMDGPAYGGRHDPYRVLLIRKDGSAQEFSTYS